MNRGSQAVRYLLEAFPGSTIDDILRSPSQQRKDPPMGLLDDLNIDYEQWRPADNPDQPRGIEGIVKDRQVWESGFGPFDMFFLVTDDGAAWSWAALGAPAAREVARRDPQPGDRMAVAYKGDIPAPGKFGDAGKVMHVFRALTEHGPRHSADYRPPAPVQAPQQGTFEDEEPF